MSKEDQPDHGPSHRNAPAARRTPRVRAGGRAHRVQLGVPGRPGAPRHPLRKVETPAVERDDRHRLVDRRGSGAQPAGLHARNLQPADAAAEALRRQDAARVQDASHGLDALPVHARRAGSAGRDSGARERGARSRREVLRLAAGRGRGASRRGLSPVPHDQGRARLPGEPAPRHPAGPDRERQPLGHDLPRHADHGRRSRARRLRLHEHHGARGEADQPDHDLRDPRRSAPRRLRRARPGRRLPADDRLRDEGARGVRRRGVLPDARPAPHGGGLGAHRARQEDLGGVVAADAVHERLPADPVLQDRAEPAPARVAHALRARAPRQDRRAAVRAPARLDAGRGRRDPARAYAVLRTAHGAGRADRGAGGTQRLEVRKRLPARPRLTSRGRATTPRPTGSPRC